MDYILIRTLTVGFGITPNLLDLLMLALKALADSLCYKITASRELHPALRNKFRRNYTPLFLKMSHLVEMYLRSLL